MELKSSIEHVCESGVRVMRIKRSEKHDSVASDVGSLITVLLGFPCGLLHIDGATKVCNLVRERLISEPFLSFIEKRLPKTEVYDV